MILFLADQHYGQHCGAQLAPLLAPDYPIEFHEDDWSALGEPLTGRCKLLMLNFISGVNDVPPPTAAQAENVRHYLAAGGNLLLLHSGPAAFWPYDWWRPSVGFRWVRGNDPDGFASSTHPKRPFALKVAKSRHPLCRKLHDFELPTDEIYIELEQTCAASILLWTTTDEGSFPMAWENHTSWGGRVLAFLPGHCPEVVRDPNCVATVRVLLDDLLAH